MGIWRWLSSTNTVLTDKVFLCLQNKAVREHSAECLQIIQEAIGPGTCAILSG